MATRLDTLEGLETMDQPAHERLVVWQLSHELALAVYRLVELFPASARFELGRHLRRAAFSIPMNLAEGNARGSVREYVQFCRVARGSLAEVRYTLRAVTDLGLVPRETFVKYAEGYDQVGKMLYSLIASLRKRKSW